MCLHRCVLKLRMEPLLFASLHIDNDADNAYIDFVGGFDWKMCKENV